MRSSNHAWIAVWMVGAWLVGTPSIQADEFPYTAVVVEDRVPIRAGAGTTFYVVGHLARGDMVTVDEVIFGWHKIVAPRLTYSYISRSHVTVGQDGRRGTITVNRAPVKAGSVQGPGDSYRRQLYLLKDDTVEILDEEGGYYKIVPPSGAYVFLPPGAVEQADPASILTIQPPQPMAKGAPVTPAGDDLSRDPPVLEASPGLRDDQPPRTPGPVEAGAAQASSGAVGPAPADALIEANVAMAVEPVVAADPRAEDKDKAADQPIEADQLLESDRGKPVDPPQHQLVGVSPPAGPGPITSGPDTFKDRVSPSVREAENWIQQVSARPLEQQPIDQMIAVYEKLWTDPRLNSEDRRIVKTRLALLGRNGALAATLKNISEVKNTVSQTGDPQEPSGSPSQASVLAPWPDAGTSFRPRYDVVGQLLASSVYNGADLPRLLRVVEPGVGRTLAYLKPAAVYQPAASLGRYVGIIGTTRYDPALKLDVIEVEQLDVLEPSSR